MKKKISRKTLVPVRLDNEQLRGIDLLCVKENCYRSEIIREAIDLYLHQHQKLEYVRKQEL